MEELFLSLSNKMDAMQAQLTKLDSLPALETAVHQLVKENSILREEVASISAEMKKKDDTIKQLSDQLNRCDQENRSKSLRIIGLPLNSNSTSDEVAEVVFKNVLQPVLSAAIEKGELNPNAIPDKNFLLDNAFVIPPKKGSNPAAIVKLSSQYVRNLVFRFKKEALPKELHPTSGKERCKFAIFEDLSPGNHALLRSFTEDRRVKSAWSWSYNGQIKFKLLNSDTIYRAKSTSDTVDSVVKPGAAAAAFEAAMSL
jgi:cobalamin biosynthesis Mg chelatase CobN